MLTWEKEQIKINNGGYGRLITLKNGKLLAAYDSANAVNLSESEDGGKTWLHPGKMTVPQFGPLGDKLCIANANVIEYAEGCLMIAYRAHSFNTEEKFYTSIRYQLSKDGGKSWTDPIILCELQREDNSFSGFWEPHMVFLPDGRMAVYYANDCAGPQNADFPYVPDLKSQYIMVHIFDFGTERFGEPIIASDGVKHKSRDGMPVVCPMQGGGMAMVIEANWNKDYRFIIQMLFSEDGIRWSEPVTVFKPTQNGLYAGAPYVTLLPDGRLAVSCQANENSGAVTGKNAVFNSTMNVIVSKKPVTLENCKDITEADFDKIAEFPLQMGSESYAIWPAMWVHGEYLLCCAQCGNNNGERHGLYLRRAPLASI